MEPLDLLYLGVAVIVAVIVFCFLFVKFGSPEKKGEQIKQIAEQNGTISVGRLVHSELVLPSSMGERRDIYGKAHYQSVYVYTVNGREYKKRYLSYQRPVDEMNFYYRPGKPRDSVSDADFQQVAGVKWRAWALILLLIAAVVYWILKLVF